MAWRTKKEMESTSYVIPAECRLDQKLCSDVLSFLDENVSSIGTVQRKTWHLINQRAFADKNDLNKYLQDTFHIKTRTANSIIKDMETKHKSLTELKKRELEELDQRILVKQEKVDEEKAFIKTFAPLAAQNILKEEDLAEYRKTKRSLYRHQQKLDRMKNRRVQLQKEIDSGRLSVCFGTKALFRKQHELEKSKFSSHEEWLEAFRKNRDKNLYYLARKEETLGNQQCHLYPTNMDGIYRLTVLDSGKDSRVGAEGFVRFMYCRPELDRQLRLHMEDSPFKAPITARFVKRSKGWYLILSLNANKTPVYTNDRSSGVVSMDFNYSFIELTELDHHGNIVNKIHLDIPHAGKGERGIHETREVIKEAVQYAALKQKPLAVEDLDFTKKRARLIKKKAIRYNEMLSSLNYGQYKEALTRRCDKDGVELIVVSPAFTTQTGKKYTQAKHLTGHEAAAWQIGRRAMGFWLNKNKSDKQKKYERKRNKDIKAKAGQRKKKAAERAAA